MISFWTLEYSGTEKSFQDWGFTDAVLSLKSQARSTFSVRVPGVSNLITNPPIPFEGQVIIRRNRAAGGGGFSGGEIVFKGRQVTDRRAATQAPGQTLVFADAWYDLENTVFQQEWKYKHLALAPTVGWFSRLVLFQAYDTVTWMGTTYNPGQLIPTGLQLKLIIDFARTQCGVNLQAGTIDIPWQMGFYPVRAAMCSSAIQICLKPVPDAVTWIDYTTTPPTFNCRQRANLSDLTLPYADGATHQSSDITPRPDLQVPVVGLQYQKTNNVSGTVWTDFFTDQYPVGASLLQPRALVCPIDLRGAKETRVSVTVTSAELDPTSLTWWKLKKQELNAPTLLALTLVDGSVKVTAEDGSDLTSTWASTIPYEHLKGEVCSWMEDGLGNPIVSQRVTISAKFTYEEYDPNNRKLHVVDATNPHSLSVRVKLTNSAPPSEIYSAVEFSDPGETAPAGLAQYIYTSLAQLQHEGRHVITERSADGSSAVSTIIGPRYRLNLTGGDASWTAMKAVIQQVHIDFFRGRTEVAFGPAKHLAPGDLEELLQLWRFRLVYDNPALRTDGNVSSNVAQLGGDTMAENTTHANVQPSLHSTTYDQTDETGGTTFVQHDAKAEKVLLNRQDDSGTAITAAGSVTMTLSHAEQQAVALQRIHYTDAQDGSAKRAIVLHGPPQSDDDHAHDGAQDLWIGGGNVKFFQVDTVYADYYKCYELVGGGLAGTATYVAKPYELRHAITSELIEGSAVGYSYAARTDNADGSRTATDGSTTQVEIVIPVWQTPALNPGPSYPTGRNYKTIVVAVQAGTGLTGGDGNPISWLDVNVDGRAWCQIA
ncbi:MAG: hypothetical protein C5B50_07735 [Verrucomicrobia bacterium]|nr:MAG: hypothetical protein C5B50_07735 [Verrucomicrobiota bacterium]